MSARSRINRALRDNRYDGQFYCTRAITRQDQATIWLSPVRGGRGDLKAAEKIADLVAGSISGYQHVWDVYREGRGFVIVAGRIPRAEVEQQMAQEQARYEQAVADREVIGQSPIAHRVTRIDLDGQLADPNLGPYHYLPSRLARRAPQIMCESGIDTAVDFWLNAGLARRTPTPTGVVIDCPTLVAVKEERDGISVALTMIQGQVLPQWEKALAHLRSALHAPNLTVRQLSVGHVELSWHDVDAFSSTDFTTAAPTPYDAANNRSALGLTSLGEPALIPWGNNSGMVVGGVPGSGKTASLLPVLAGLAGHAELHVHDGKAGHDLSPLAPISTVFDRTGELAPVLEDVESVVELMKARVDQMPDLFGESNFWTVPADRREQAGVYPVFVILDECQTYLDDSGLEKDEKVEVSRIRKGVRTLIQKGRSAGVIVVLTTQKPDAQSIPTVIRDNAALRVCFNVSTRQQAETVLPTIGEGDPTPLGITTAQKGRAVLEVEGKGLSAVQSWYVQPTAISEYLRGFSPVPAQAQRFGLGGGQAARTAVADPAPAPVRVPTPTPTPTPVDVSKPVDMSKPEPAREPTTAPSPSAWRITSSGIEQGGDPEPAPAPAPFIPPTTGTAPAQTPNLFG